MTRETESGQAWNKRTIATFILFGIFILWVGLLLMATGVRSLVSTGRILSITGSLFAFSVALVGGLGSPTTSDSQNLGLLIVAAALIVASVWVI